MTLAGFQSLLLEWFGCLSAALRGAPPVQFFFYAPSPNPS